MKTITYSPLAGEHILNACKEAVALAMNGAQNVAFSFNGIALRATPETVPRELASAFNENLEANAKACRESPKGIADAERRTVASQRMSARKEIECVRCGYVSKVAAFIPLRLACCPECKSLRIRLYKTKGSKR